MYLSFQLVLLPVCSSNCRYSAALATSNTRDLQHNLGFTQWPFRASMQVYPAIHLASVVLLNYEGGFHNPFTHVSFMTLKPEPLRRHCQFDDHLGVNSGPLESHLQQLWFVLIFRDINLCLFPFASCRTIWVGSCPENTTPSIPLWVRPLFDLLISFITNLGFNIKFPGAIFALQIVHFCIPFYPICSFSW